MECNNRNTGITKRESHSEKNRRSSQSNEVKEYSSPRKESDSAERRSKKSRNSDKKRDRRRRRHDEDSESDEKDHRSRHRHRKEKRIAHDNRRDQEEEHHLADGHSSKKHRRSSSKRSSRSKYDDDEKNRKSSSRYEDDRHHRSSKSRKKKQQSDIDTESSSDYSDGRSRKRNRKKRRKEDSRKERNHEKLNRRPKESRKEEKNNRDKSSLYPIGTCRGVPPSIMLDEENDYFSYHQHLWLYLYRDEELAFNDLTAEESRKAFRRFVKKYNKGELEEAYYEGLPPQALQQCRTTHHKWSFKTSKTELKRLETLEEGVRKQTEYNNGTNEATQKSNYSEQHVQHVKRNIVKCRVADNDDTGIRGRQVTNRAENKRLRENVKATFEELTGGKKDGKERLVEKRMEKSAQIHGAAKQKESQMAGIELTDDAIYGGGRDSSFRAALSKERMRASYREEKKTARMKELLEKERKKQGDMLNMLGLSGLKPGQKIVIAPRKDGN